MLYYSFEHTNTLKQQAQCVYTKLMNKKQALIFAISCTAAMIIWNIVIPASRGSSEQFFSTLIKFSSFFNLAFYVSILTVLLVLLREEKPGSNKTQPSPQNAMENQKTPAGRNQATRFWLKLAAGFLLLTALAAIVCILVGDFGWFEARILISTSSIGLASLCALASSSAMADPRWQGISKASIIIAIAAALLLIIAVWAEIDTEGLIKTISILWVMAVGSAVSLAFSRFVLSPRHQWALYAALINNAIIMLMVTTMILTDFDTGDFLFRLLAVQGIILALSCIFLPILARTRHPSDQQ
ncbi:MAG: hypothetical protein D6B26_05040 [Spirochaetaceae bacterium]|nr:MAG: hypothetical protein D6B26_05040 [Spirochaetaceae bacterium]